MAYGVIMCYHLHMPLYILGTFTEYPYTVPFIAGTGIFLFQKQLPISYWELTEQKSLPGALRHIYHIENVEED